MKWIGYFFLFLLLLFLFLIFIKIKVYIIFQDESRYVQIRYLFFKYKIDLRSIMKGFDSKAESQIEKVKDQVTVEKEEEKIEPKTITVVEQSQEYNEPPKKKIRRFKKKEKVKEVKQEVSKPKLRALIRKFKILFRTGKRVLIRMTKKIRVHSLDSVVHFSVDDPMLNGCLIGGVWALQSNIYGMISRYVKAIDDYHFDVLSQFSGNRIFVDFTCIVSFKLVDIIVVLLTSFEDLKVILKTIRTEEDL